MCCAVRPGPLLGSRADMQRYHQAYVKFAQLLERPDISNAWLHEFLLAPGDVLTFNQRRMLHGRRAFRVDPTGLQIPNANDDHVLPQRHLKGTYLNIDDFLSRYRVLRVQAGLCARGIDDSDHIGCRSL